MFWADMPWWGYVLAAVARAVEIGGPYAAVASVPVAALAIRRRMRLPPASGA
jgi:hypothetical protein